MIKTNIPTLAINPLTTKMYLPYIKRISFNSRRTHFGSISKINGWNLYSMSTEIIVVRCDNHAEKINRLWWKSVEFLVLKREWEGVITGAL